MVAFNLQTPAMHPAEHPKNVKNRFVEAVAGECAKAGKVGLIFKFESPGQRALEIDAIFMGQLMFASEARGCVAGIHCAVAVSELRTLASCATFGIRFAD